MQFKLNRKETITQLLLQEDATGDCKITIEDKGNKFFEIISIDGVVFKVKGTYYLANLLQELALSTGTEVILELSRIIEKPVDRLVRVIQEFYWDKLTRTIDAKGVQKVVDDEKMMGERYRIYVPITDPKAVSYYRNFAKSNNNISIEILPKDITPAYVQSINNKPGVLSLALNDTATKGIPFVVPGGRFNEMYGWDSYFINKGLLLDEKWELAKGMIDNLSYQIQHYGKILNANRTYYLTRTQPPFFTAMLVEYIDAYPKKVSLNWLRKHVEMAILEYQQVWMQTKRYSNSGLNCFYGEGIGMPPETEVGHFDHVFEKYFSTTNKEQLKEGIEKYQKNPELFKELEAYFIQDRSMRESGHDTTHRFKDKCAHVNPVDLNSLLYAYEMDLAMLIEVYFEDNFKGVSGTVYNASYWSEKANKRKKKIDELLWNPRKAMYLDYQYVEKEQNDFEAASTFYPLWAKLASKEQAAKIVKSLFDKFKSKGGILGSTKEAIAYVSKDSPVRQWDYPFGWAPHQMLIWEGLLNYDYKSEAEELIYRWLWLIVKTAVDYNGLIPEKFNVVENTHKVFAEYGNVGTQFKYVPDGGFGWMNASFKFGISLLSEEKITMLNNLISPEEIYK